MLTKEMAVSALNERLAAGDPDRALYRRVRASYEGAARAAWAEAVRAGEAPAGPIEPDVIRLAAEERMAEDGIREGVSA